NNDRYKNPKENDGFSDNSEDDMSDDEIRVSKYSNDFNKMWNKKIKGVIKEIDKIISYDRRKELSDYIKEKVEMLYRETKSKPIDEFLNVNENKTRFVISDYIRAKMISDNPSDGKNENRARNRILEVFSALSEFLYSKKYADIWNLVSQRYDDFEKNPDINRLKVLFCDRYTGTSTRDYNFDTEIKTLEYYEMISKTLACELGIDLDGSLYTGPNRWNTYNAVNMLFECKKKNRYRFFSLFSPEDVYNKTKLNNIIMEEEKFCFYETAYNMLAKTNGIWDVSYFLESQLYTENHKINKKNNLPKLPESQINNTGEYKSYTDDWICINRGEENDELYNCIEELIKNIKKLSDAGKEYDKNKEDSLNE
ncbi:MAG: hypothetical protein LUD77_04345, partial [Clostridiales bacterium]|nr:hypothetical protein [Clostridiales bacterium]